MTSFNFTLFNHCSAGRLELGDLVNILEGQLVELGHSVSQSDEFKGDINLVFERFDAGAVAHLQENKQGKVVIIATEVPGENAFNNGYRADMKYRQEFFPQAAKSADAIWVLAPDPFGWYYDKAEKVAPIQLGHAYSMRQPCAANPAYDFAFYGQMTKYRDEVLRFFINAGFNVNIAGKILDKAARDKLVTSAKAVLELSAYPNSPLISSSRCATTLHLGRAVFCEPKDCDSEWRDIISVAQPETVLEQARDVIENWRQVYWNQKEAFRKRLTPEFCLGAAMKTVN